MTQNYSGKKVVIWGLGVNGGGLASALFFLKQGISLTILDDKSASDLAVSLTKLEAYESLYRLSPTNEQDLKEADLVIKNPGIRKSHPLLKLCRHIETDISLFLENNKNPLLTVTGSKGKSSLVTILDHVLKTSDADSKLGGNITYSPLNFLSELNGKSPVVLELSSWQLGDLPSGLLKPQIALLTNLYHDHQNTYAHFDDYVHDKMRIFENQSEGDIFFCEAEAYQSHVARHETKPFAGELILFPSLAHFEDGTQGEQASLFVKDNTVFYGDKAGQTRELFSLPEQDLRLVRYTKMMAGAMAIFYGLERTLVEKALEDRITLAHRLEFVAEKDGVDYYNDSAGTLPDATVASSQSLLEEYGSLVLIVGGTDKDLDFSCFKALFRENIQWVLLSGSATLKLQEILDDKGVVYSLWDTLEECVEEARYIAEEGEVILFSPASASFEKFKNEFDRGNQFKDLVNSL